MERTEKYGLIVSKGVDSIIKLEKFLENLGYNVRILPIPSGISSQCGFSLKVELFKIDEIIEIVEGRKEEFSCEYYIIHKVGFKKDIKKYR